MVGLNIRMNRICAVWIALLLCVALLPQPVLAAGDGDTARPVSLVIRYNEEEEPAAGVAFRLYLAGEVAEDGQAVLTGAFAKYPVLAESPDSSVSKELAEMLAGYAAREQLVPIDSGETDAEGILSFPTQGQLTAGLYLVTGVSHVKEGRTYIIEPFLIALPAQNEDGGAEYEVTVVPKYESGSGTAELTAAKAWDDAGNESSRPSQIEVQLVDGGDGSVYDTAVLNEDNNWRCTWKELPEGHDWYVIEKEVPAEYTVSIERSGDTVVLTNTCRAETPDTPSEPSLPQTGTTWYLVPVLAVVGLLLFMIGWVLRRRNGE